jgi:signal transduction histidine kinase
MTLKKPGLLNNLSLQKKFILITTGAVIVLMFIIGFILIKWQRDLMYHNIKQQGKLLAETLATPVMSIFSRNLLYAKVVFIDELEAFGDYYSEIVAKKELDLIYVVVLDKNGNVISHQNTHESRKVYNDSITARALVSDTTLVQKFRDETSGYDALDVSTPLLFNDRKWGTLKLAVSLKKIDHEIQKIIISAVIFTFFLLIGGICIIMFLSGRFIKPITQLARTMEKAGGDTLDVQVDLIGQDEIAFLGQSFNNMIDRIRESNLKVKRTHKRLLRFAKTIETTDIDSLNVRTDIDGKDEIKFLVKRFNKLIDQIRHSKHELKVTHEKLFHSQKLASLGIFASGVAHEINNPLGGVSNCIQILEKMGDNKELREKYFSLIHDGLKRIEDTVSKLLWMSRKEGKNPTVVQIKPSLKEVYRFTEYRIKENDITYTSTVEDDVSVYIDPHDLHQVITNLMINAVQSMKDGGKLSVHAHRNDANVILEVSDTGEGIEEKELKNIFDPFYSTKQPGEGTGLGLWLTYEIVKNYGGEITVHSEKGKGSTFKVQFKQTTTT